jgi:hypothetical protein
MTEGTVPVPHTSPALIAMMTYYLIGVIAFVGSHSDGGERSMDVQFLFEHFL